MQKRSRTLLIAVGALGILAMGFAGWYFGRIGAPASVTQSPATSTPEAVASPAATPPAPDAGYASTPVVTITGGTGATVMPTLDVNGNLTITLVNPAGQTPSRAIPRASESPSPQNVTLSRPASGRIGTVVRPGTVVLRGPGNFNTVDANGNTLTFTNNTADGATTTTHVTATGTLLINGQGILKLTPANSPAPANAQLQKPDAGLP